VVAAARNAVLTQLFPRRRLAGVPGGSHVAGVVFMLFARHSRSSLPIPFADGYLSGSGGAPKPRKRWDIVREGGRLKSAPRLIAGTRTVLRQGSALWTTAVKPSASRILFHLDGPIPAMNCGAIFNGCGHELPARMAKQQTVPPGITIGVAPTELWR
jgi:hypothetical protein